MQPTLIPRTEEVPTGEFGEVFTRRWVVELILDLSGYSTSEDLVARRVLEPACGTGAFLVPVVERLLDSASLHGYDVSELMSAVVAYDLLDANVFASRRAVRSLLLDRGVDPVSADQLVASWIRQGDFLLSSPGQESFDLVVGNPPYIRLEAVPEERSDAYRRACSTMGGRADVYVGFYELGLKSLKTGGVLGFICADRWMRNAYGAKLRELVASAWSVDAVVSMTGVDAFEDEVDAYPAITILSRRPQIGGPFVFEGSKDLGENGAREIAEFATGEPTDRLVGDGVHGTRLHRWFAGRSGWPHGSPERLAVVSELEESHPPLENDATGTKVGIGIASGADKVFIVEDPELFEPERLLPIAMVRDISTGTVKWGGRYLANPWSSDGLVDLEDWPRFAEYLGQHEELLRKRHTARSGRWHKTIDRQIDGLAGRQKLYLPDFKDSIFPVLDEGTTYPHHNLYWVTSDLWDMKVLGGLLLSDVANLFIEAYSVRMRGGFYRFQAQYLRRIRLPDIDTVDEPAAAALTAAFEARDRAGATEVALPLYGLTELPT